MEIDTPNRTQKPTLKVKDLKVGYLQGSTKIPVVENINFAISAGELSAIVGVNGIGKSTLLRTLGKVQPALSGTIEFNGMPIGQIKARELAAEVSLVLTDPIATRNLSVLELISLGRQPYTNWIGSLTAKDKEKIRQAINIVGLESLSHKKCYELSDGQLQKVMIARAIAQDTGIILLDEPTTHLDLYHKVQVLRLLQKIAHEQGKTILFTTHEIDMAIQLCDTMLLLDNVSNPYASPCTLIEDKCFDSLFPTDLLHFDTKAGSFKVHKSSPRG